MKRGLIVLMFLILVSSGYALDSSIVREYVEIDVAMLNQDPLPAQPGEYVDIVFRVDNHGLDDAKSVQLELKPEYPFSLDPGEEAVRDLGMIKGLSLGYDIDEGWEREPYYVGYRLRVDEGAVDGYEDLKLSYHYMSGNNQEMYVERTFDVRLNSSKTDLDVVVQEIVGDKVTLAIVNTGKFTAYSVVVTIPDQDNFNLGSVSETVVGNLERGDYAFTNFLIRTMNGEELIDVDLTYTDVDGNRIELERDAMLKSIAEYEEVVREEEEAEENGNNGIRYLIIGIVGLVIIIVLYKIFSRKRKLVKK